MTRASTLTDRVLTLLPWKLFVGVALAVVFSLAYYGNQCVSPRPVFPMPTTWLDRAIPFDTGATGLYLSWYLMLPVVPLLIGTHDQLRRYALGLLVIGLVGNTFFLLYPTGVARPPLPEAAGWMYRLVVAMDKPVNACPSMHAALSIFTALWFARLCADEPRLALPRPALWAGAMWLWAVAILYGTLATRQHVVIDLVAGTALAWACYVITTSQQSAPAALPAAADGAIHVAR